jgi:hypothetical protein
MSATSPRSVLVASAEISETDATLALAEKVVRSMIVNVSPEMRAALAERLSDILRPPRPPVRMGEATARVVRLIQSDRQNPEWTAQEIQNRLGVDDGKKDEAKKVLNSLSYLTKLGYLKRMSYGRYHVRDYGFGIVDSFDHEG